MRRAFNFLLLSVAILVCPLLGSIAGWTGNSVASDAPSHLTLAIKFVEFTGLHQPPPLSREKAREIVANVNSVYGQCGIHVVEERYEVVDPTRYGLNYTMASMEELDPDRKPFDDSHELVVINTGAWNHVQMGSANAWTSMPGQLPAGAVIEGPVADYAPLVAHELGHYLGLEHVSDAGNLMNPIIYSSSTRIEPDQCAIMRQTAVSSRSGALRNSA